MIDGKLPVPVHAFVCCGEVDGVRFGIPHRLALRGTGAPTDLRLAAAA